MKIGMFFEDESDFKKIESFCLKKIANNKETIIQHRKWTSYNQIDIATDKNQYIIRKATDYARGYRFHEVYVHNVKDEEMLTLLHTKLIPPSLDWDIRMKWKASSHFHYINDEDLE